MTEFRTPGQSLRRRPELATTSAGELITEARMAVESGEYPGADVILWLIEVAEFAHQASGREQAELFD